MLDFVEQGLKMLERKKRRSTKSNIFSKKTQIKTEYNYLITKDIIKVNGFNEEITTWGREDSEFVHRMLNKGTNRLYLKFAGIGYHLYHPENSRGSLPENDAILDNTVNQKLTFCQNGINQFISEKGCD